MSRRYTNEFSKEIIREGKKLLMASCVYAKNRTRHKHGTYAQVKCSFKTPKKMFNSLCANKRFMKSWYEYTTIYLENNRNRSFRPVIDRINEKGHYYVYNIQPLSFSENSSKARKK
jgi:hypothetical protein